MTIKFTNKQITELERINLPKVNRKAVYLGDNSIYLKVSKDNIIDLGNKDLYKEINHTLSVNINLGLLLYLALCGNEKVTTFKGDPSEVIKKIAENHPEYSYRDGHKEHLYKEFYKLKEQGNLDTLEYYPVNRYFTKSLNVDSVKSELRKDIKDLQSSLEDTYYTESSKRYFRERLATTRGKLKDSSNYILTILDHINLDFMSYKIISTTDSKKGTNEYYDTVFKNMNFILDSMVPQTSVEHLHGLKVRYLRDNNSMKTKEDIVQSKSHFNSKSGDMLIYVKTTYGYMTYELNLYKENLDSFYLGNGLTFTMVLKVLISKYSTKGLNYDLILNIIKGIGNNHKLNLTGGFHSRYSTYDLLREVYTLDHSTVVLSNDKFDNYEGNVLKPLVDIVLVFDRIINSNNTDLFNTLSRYVKVPQGKYKLHDLFGLSKQLFVKLVEHNDFERKNFMAFRDLIQDRFQKFNTLEHLNQLFDEDFLMVQRVGVVSDSFRFEGETFETFDFSFSEFRKIVRYLDIDVPDRQRIVGFGVTHYYRDFIDSLAKLIRLGYRTMESVNLTPFSLKLEHDIVTDEIRTLEAKANEELLKQAYGSTLDYITKKTYRWTDSKGKEYETVFIVADTPDKLKEEGKALSHCVGGYANKIIKGTCLILLARNKEEQDKSWFTVEIRKTRNGLVLGQQQSLTQYKLPNTLSELLVKDIKHINKENNKEERLSA